MRNTFLQFMIACSLAIVSCTSLKKVNRTDDGKINITYVQVNDVYEIAPLEGGKSGGMARIASLKKQYLRTNPNTFMVISGDFLSPSVYNSLQYQGKRIRGRQMVEAMNSAGMDIAVFGNHEFDISEAELQDRLNESKFKWVSSNTFHKKAGGVSAFVKSSSAGSEALPQTMIQTVTDADGTKVRIGYIGLTLPFNKAAYVSYTDPLQTADSLYRSIKDSCDAVIAITHLLMEDDVKLAQRIPGLAMILGGHEHDMRFQKVGNVYITKAHANARSAYILNLSVDKKNHKVEIKPELKMINDSVAIDPATDSVVQKWNDIADKNYASIGFDSRKVVLQSGEPLDGREAEIRKRPTNFTRMIVAAMQQAAPQADAVIVNSGSIRVDDILPMPVTQYDIIRSLPFGGGIKEVDMKGKLLVRILEAGLKNSGIGGYLQYSADLTNTAGKWTLKNMPVDPEKTYRIALSEFLLTGGEANLDFLNPSNPDILKVYPTAAGVEDPRSDIRLAIVRYLEKMK